VAVGAVVITSILQLAVRVVGAATTAARVEMHKVLLEHQAKVILVATVVLTQIALLHKVQVAGVVLVVQDQIFLDLTAAQVAQGHPHQLAVLL
jgi:hypothetical protein